MLHYQTNEVTGILELNDAWDIGDDDEVGADNATLNNGVTPLEREAIPRRVILFDSAHCKWCHMIGNGY
jgi:hypothetical protein